MVIHYGVLDLGLQVVMFILDRQVLDTELWPIRVGLIMVSMKTITGSAPSMNLGSTHVSCKIKSFGAFYDYGWVGCFSRVCSRHGIIRIF